MVLFFTSTAADPPVTLYMGKDKFENEDLIKYAWPQDVWFHVDKLSSAHVYLRRPDSMPSWEDIPEPVLADCAQLVKANSIEGNKKNNITIIYSPASNLKKTGDMAVGQVSFKSDKIVKRIHVEKRENPVVNRLNKTKIEREVNHEQERIDRLRKEKNESHAAAAKRRKEEEELALQRAKDKQARDYALLDVEDNEDSEDQPRQTVEEMMEDFM